MLKKAILKVKIQTRSSRREIIGWHDDEVKIKLTNPPIENQANRELLKFLSSKLGISKSSIEIVSGQTSSHKRIMIEGLSQREAIDKLNINK